MRTVINTGRGSAKDTLEIMEREIPEPAAGEVRVKMAASGVNPSDVKVRSGAQGPMVADTVIPHNDGAGVIDALGEGVESSRLGTRCWLFNINRSEDGLRQSANGTAAEYVCVPAALCATLPDSIPFEVGACLGVPAMTAHRAVFSRGSVNAQQLLISGGAGSVGMLAIQMACADGATVVATVSGEDKARIAKEAGAHHVFNYKTQALNDVLLAEFGPNSFDQFVDVDFASHIGMTTSLLKANGHVAAYASASDLQPAIPYYPLMFNNTSIQLVFVYGMPLSAKQQAISDITRLLEVGVLDPHIAKTFSLSEIIDAHELVESQTAVGNVVVKI